MHIALIILAAGASRRFGAADKLLAELGGEPLIVRNARSLMQVERAGVSVETIAVTTDLAGPVAAALRQHLGQACPRVVANPNAHAGMGGSIAAGIAGIATHARGALIVPGDMPFLNARFVERLLAAFVDSGGTRPAHPVLADGTSVGPVVWPPMAFGMLMALSGDNGGRGLLAEFETVKVALVAGEDHVLADVDTPADLARLTRVVDAVGKPGRI